MKIICNIWCLKDGNQRESFVIDQQALFVHNSPQIFADYVAQIDSIFNNITSLNYRNLLPKLP